MLARCLRSDVCLKEATAQLLAYHAGEMAVTVRLLAVQCSAVHLPAVAAPALLQVVTGMKGLLLLLLSVVCA